MGFSGKLKKLEARLRGTSREPSRSSSPAPTNRIVPTTDTASSNVASRSEEALASALGDGDDECHIASSTVLRTDGSRDESTMGLPDHETGPNQTEGLKASLWNGAHDKIRSDDPTLFAAYEKTLKKLKDSSSKAGDSGTFHDAHNRDRRQEMEDYIEIGLQRTKKEAEVKGKIAEGMELINSVREIVGQTVQAVPQAALPWAGVILVLEVVVNPLSESAAQREGILHVLKRIHWYDGLADALLHSSKDSTDLREMGGETRLNTSSLKDNIVDLYAKFLSYVMRSVHAYHSNRFLATFGDLVKYNDWETQLEAIKRAEDEVRKDVDQYIAIERYQNSQSPLKTDVFEAFQAWTKTQEDDEIEQLLSGVSARMTKENILDKKGELFASCSTWLFERGDFRDWLDDPAQHVLLITGDPGKGKTMLLCSLVDWLEDFRGLTYFFCRDEDPLTNNQTAVFRGLIREITRRNPELFKHVRDKKSELRLQGTYLERALFNILQAIVEDPIMANSVIVVDALDECRECKIDREGTHSTKDMISDLIKRSKPGPKWILSSRNYLVTTIQNRVGGAGRIFHIDLDISLPQKAVEDFVHQKLAQADLWSQDEEPDQATLRQIEATLVSKAGGTYLYVSLVLADIEKELEYHVLVCSVADFIVEKVSRSPESLEEMYAAMLHQLCREKDSSSFQDILRLVFVAKRPLAHRELQYLAQQQGLRGIENPDKLFKFFRQGSAFLSVSKETVSFIHQSARDFIEKRGWKGDAEIRSSDVHQAHWDVFCTSIEIMSGLLKKDMYGLIHPGKSIGDVVRPEPDPLAPLTYSCIHYVHHLLCSGRMAGEDDAPEMLQAFLSEHVLKWIEALSLMRELSAGVEALEHLQDWSQNCGCTALSRFVHDAHRLLRTFWKPIEECPLQIYASVLVFSPTFSLVKAARIEDQPTWITYVSGVEPDWDPSYVIHELPSSHPLDVVFWDDGVTLSSLSSLSSLHSPPSHSWLSTPFPVANAVHAAVWHTSSGGLRFEPWELIKSHKNQKSTIIIDAMISGNGKRMVVVDFPSDGQYSINTLDGLTGESKVITHESTAEKIHFAISPSGRYLIARPLFSPLPCLLTVWDLESDREPSTDYAIYDQLFPHQIQHDGYEARRSVVFLTETRFALMGKMEVHVRDLQGGLKESIPFSNCRHIITSNMNHRSSSRKCTMNERTRFVLWNLNDDFEVWDLVDDKVHILRKVHHHHVYDEDDVMDSVHSVWLPRNGSILGILTSGTTEEGVLHVWDLDGTATETRRSRLKFGAHVSLGAFSDDGKLVAVALYDHIEIWDTESGLRLYTFQGHIYGIDVLVFSPNSHRLASGSWDGTIRVWDMMANSISSAHEDSDSSSILYSWDVIFSPDGLAFVAHSGQEARLWDDKGEKSWALARRSSGSGSRIKMIFSSDGRMLTDGYNVWDVSLETPVILHSAHLLLSLVGPFAFSKTGMYLAQAYLATRETGGSFMYIHQSVIISLGKGDTLSAFELKPPNMDITWKSNPTCLTFLEGDEHLVCGTGEGELLLSDRHGKHQNGVGTDEGTIRALETVVDPRGIEYLVSASSSGLRIWDVTGRQGFVCVRILRIGPLYQLLQSPSDSWRFFTNLGAIDTRKYARDPFRSGPKTKTTMGVIAQGYGIKDGWVTKNGARILWLPMSYRPRRPEVECTIWGSKVVMWTNAGKLLVLHFSEHVPGEDSVR